MSSKIDSISTINISDPRRVWKIRVRVVRLWRSPNRKQPELPEFIDMLFVDAKNDTIQCTVWSSHVKNFESLLREGMCYEIVNTSVALNSYKYKPSNHPFRLYFKLHTTAKPIEDAKIPHHGLNFADYNDTFNSPTEHSKLVDVIGVVKCKGELSEYAGADKVSNYIVVELDNLHGGDNMVCTLWEEFAQQLLQYEAEGNNGPVVLILQLARMKLFKKKMGITNTSYNTKLLINLDVPEVHDLQQRFVAALPDASYDPLLKLPSSSMYSVTDDVLNKSDYKTIAELKNITEDGTYVTYGTVKDIDLRTGWSYRGCPTKNCLTGVRGENGKYFCRKCNKGFSNVTFRYNVQLTVADGTNSATFTIFDCEANNFLKKSAAELHNLYAARALPDEDYPRELDTFKEFSNTCNMCRYR